MNGLRSDLRLEGRFMNQGNSLAGRNFLVVEDEYLLADDIASRFRSEGAEVVGPAASVDDALDLLDAGAAVDGAVLDLNLQGEKAFPVADLLVQRNVPFVFATGYDSSAIPERFAGVTRCEKPVDPATVIRALLG